MGSILAVRRGNVDAIAFAWFESPQVLGNDPLGARDAKSAGTPSRPESARARKALMYSGPRRAMTPQDGVDAMNATSARCRGTYDISV
jgi:hypothetical protein